MIFPNSGLDLKPKTIFPNFFVDDFEETERGKRVRIGLGLRDLGKRKVGGGENE